MSGAAAEQDTVIVVGAGLAGLATAIGAAVNGRRAVVLEAADNVGGAAAYSGGQVWIGANHVEAREGIEDSLEETELYVRSIAHEIPELLDEPAMHRWLQTAPVAARYWEEIGAISWVVIPGLVDYHSEAEGAHGVGRYLTNAPIDGSSLGEWRSRLNVSPHFPVGVSYDEIVRKGRRQALLDMADDGSDPLTFGTGVVAWFLRRALELQDIEILPGHRVVSLLTDDDGAVVGAVAEGPDGRVERRGPVVLATSSYDRDEAKVHEFLGLEQEDWGSVAPQSLRGDGIDLATSVGGVIGRIPGNLVPMLPGWPDDNEPGFTYGPEYALPHAIIVNRAGRRFCDDSYWVSFIHHALDPDAENVPCYLIWDSEHRRHYGMGKTPPGGDYPAGTVVSAPTISELGTRLGVDGPELERTVEAYNKHAVDGEDPEFGRGTVPFVATYAGDPQHRPNALVGEVAEAPFYGMRLRIVGTGIGSTGVKIDGDGHVVREDGSVIPGLFAVGSVAALLSSGSGYNSGFALGRGLTLAYLVSHELADKPVPPTVMTASR
jgi:3-oxosteroid 1-dehydrogenase